ncbi:aminotransferase family protein [Capillimicrobium parvum]|uniref:Aminotransferase n=1 Tax=Capillimicrobium parvum TaxID=2884022 RepID=A0A9E7C0I7_9ACTN|nr:aspartate aminotransferase family protein [Capillimicrobium parvum]UGS35577.1 putative aminotransferase [Capillimicrobium parvum]
MDGAALRAPERHPGPTERLRADARRHLWHWGVQLATWPEAPLTLVEGRGTTVVDADGREYLDAISGLGVVQVGHGCGEIAEAVAAQARRLAFASLANGVSNDVATRLSVEIARLAPGDLEVSFLTTGGGEAVETAIKMARQYHALSGEPRRTKLIAREGSYHGLTLGALSATGVAVSRRPFEPLLPGFHHVEHPEPARFDGTSEECGELALRSLEARIEFEGPETIAAFIAEPVSTAGAIKVPPPNYWPGVQRICARHGILLIVDEIFCGFGRTGRMFGGEHWDVRPDIMTLAKGITSGYAPLSATVTSRRIADAFWAGPETEFQHAATSAGHPVSCAAALVNIAVIERDGLVDRAAEMGALLGDALRPLVELDGVSHVSGIGLLWGVELERPDPARIRRLLAALRERGVLARGSATNVFLYPPLIVTAAEVDLLAGAVADALTISASE